MSTATAPARARKTDKGKSLIRTIVLNLQPMTHEAFAPYGEIISERGQLELDLDGGRASACAQTVEARAFTFDFLGRHERTEQVFAPLGNAQSVLAVAPPCGEDEANPDAQRFAAFLIDGTCAFKLHRGTWHTSAFPLGDSATFLVLDRESTLEDDYDLRDLKTALGIVVEIER